MIKYVADSSCDMYTGAFPDFISVPLLMYTDKDEFLDDGTIDIPDMIDKLAHYSGRSYTSCPSTDSWLKAFEGGDEIYVVTITSGLSGSYNSALVAKDMYLSEHPEAKIEVFDSLSAGPELRMAIEKIIECKKSGMPFEEVCTTIHQYIDNVKLLFVLASVHNLAENGRVNKLVASAIGVLGISVIGIADEAGTIKPFGKARGDKKIINELMKHFDELGYAGGKLCIGNVYNEDLGCKIADAIHAKYPDAPVSIVPSGGLCSYYAEKNGIMIGFECKQ